MNAHVIYLQFLAAVQDIPCHPGDCGGTDADDHCDDGVLCGGRDHPADEHMYGVSHNDQGRNGTDGIHDNGPHDDIM